MFRIMVAAIGLDNSWGDSVTAFLYSGAGIEISVTEAVRGCGAATADRALGTHEVRHK